MIAHALTIVKNELELHLGTYGGGGQQVDLGNLAEGFGNGAGGGEVVSLRGGRWSASTFPS